MATTSARKFLQLRHKVIESKRLFFLPIHTRFDGLVHLHYTPEIAQYLYTQPCSNVSETRLRIWKASMEMEACLRSTYAVFRTDSEKFVGCATIRHNNEHPRSVHWVAKHQQGQGFGTEILNTLNYYTRHFLGKNFLQVTVAEQNEKAFHILERLRANRLEHYILKSNEIGVKNKLVTFRLYS